VLEDVGGKYFVEGTNQQSVEFVLLEDIVSENQSSVGESSIREAVK